MLNLLDRSAHVPLPRFGGGTNDVAAFRRSRRWIELGVQARRDARGGYPAEGRWLGKTATPHESWIGFAKRSAYQLISHYVEAGDVTLFERIVRLEARQLGSKVKLVDNPFYYGLVALFPDSNIVRRQDRSLFGMQMLYAYQHRVPPELLIGFLYQSGNQSLMRKKLARGYVESGFETAYDANIWSEANNRPEMLSPDDDIDPGGDDDVGVITSG